MPSPLMGSTTIVRITSRPCLALWLLCSAIYLCFAPGRILFPDDEIVFQTTQSMWERGSLAIEGIAHRTGEPKGRPDGTFGWAEGLDGQRYGFFGHALSVVALPLYGLGRAAASHAPAAWRHVIRSDHYIMHRRSRATDWPRMLVSFTNCIVTALSVVLLVQWLHTLGYPQKIAVLTGLVYALGTSAWPYSGTFLSEPLSAAALLASAWGIARYHRDRIASESLRSARRSLGMAGLVAGLSVHIHVLNILAIPGLVGYAWIGASDRSTDRGAWLAAVALGAIGPLTLGIGHAMRFGSVWETGRYDHYGYFVAPWPGLVGQLVGPGRSLLLYSPALLLALSGWPRVWRRHRAAAMMVLVVVVMRWCFVSARSDWWGGWGIGPRYLVPLIPLLVLPLAEVIEGVRTAPVGRRFIFATALVACGLIELHLSLHSIFEWMLRLIPTGTPHMDYLTRSHWIPSASPLWGFFSLPPDVLVGQSWRLAQYGHPGPWRLYVAVMLVGSAAGAYLLWWLSRGEQAR